MIPAPPSASSGRHIYPILIHLTNLQQILGDHAQCVACPASGGLASEPPVELLDDRAIAYGEERRIRFSRPVCSEQVSASETLPILPGWNNPALELLICDCPGASTLYPLQVSGRHTL